MEVTDEQIKIFCKYQGYKLISIDKIAFRYQRKDGSEHGLLKAGACSFEIHECCTCGHLWRHGHNGSHSCAENLKRDAKRWRALMSSERIRILGSAGLGSKDYQHFGMEIWSKFPDGASGETDHGQQVLTTYADSIISAESIL